MAAHPWWYSNRVGRQFFTPHSLSLIVSEDLHLARGNAVRILLDRSDVLSKVDRRYPWRTRTGVSAVLTIGLLLLPFSPAGAAPAAPLAGAAPAAVAPASTLAPAYTQAKTFDAQMIALINTARAAAGVPRLVEATGLTRLAVYWSTQLQSGTTGYQLQHNPAAWTMVTTYGAANRQSWGENVAWSSSTASSAQQIFTAYMNSPGHRANILAAGYRFIGMGTVPGAHGLFNTTEFTDAVQPGEAVIPVPADGTFVTDTTTRAVYVLAGGAPVYVSSWTPFGGGKPTVAVSHDQLASWPVSPRNGTFVVTPGTNAVYRIVGGAPVYVSSWTPFGGPKPVVRIDPAAVARAGTGTFYNHLSVVPVDGSFIRTPGTGAIYRIAGGAPVYVSSWTAFGGTKTSVDVDPAAVAKAGSGSYFNHLSVLPANGTYIRTPADGAVYRIAGGAPLYVASWAPLGGPKPSVDIDPQAVARGGQAGVWSHLLMYPVTPTYLQAAGGPAIYQVVNGKATHLLSWSTVGGQKPFTVVHPLAISLAGTGGFYNHLK